MRLSRNLERGCLRETGYLGDLHIKKRSRRVTVDDAPAVGVSDLADVRLAKVTRGVAVPVPTASGTWAPWAARATRAAMPA